MIRRDGRVRPESRFRNLRLLSSRTAIATYYVPVCSEVVAFPNSPPPRPSGLEAWASSPAISRRNGRLEPAARGTRDVVIITVLIVTARTSVFVCPTRICRVSCVLGENTGSPLSTPPHRVHGTTKGDTPGPRIN